MELHEDLKIKRQASTLISTSISTHTPLFTGHGPVQPGVTFNPSSTGVVSKAGSASTSGPSSSSKTGVASASAPTHSNAASVLEVGVGGFGLGLGVQLVRVLI